jgi:hypothetical protein
VTTPSHWGVPWNDSSWLAEMGSWVDGRLAEAGIRRRSELARVWLRPRAALLTLETNRGRMWAKAVPAIFAHEVAVTELLADIDPGIVPPVVAADRALGRIITEHVDGPILSELHDDPAVWTAALSRLAEIQRVLASEPAALTAAGAVAAPLARLADDLPILLGDDELLLVGQPDGLTRREATALRRRIPALVRACRALDASGIPDSLDHGDLAPDEVIIGAMGPVFLDWSDGSITHPFLSAASLLADAGGGGPRVPADQLAAAYLGPWLSAGLGLTMEAGMESLALARTVLPLHRAGSYAKRIRPGLDDPGELALTVPRALRAILPG